MPDQRWVFMTPWCVALESRLHLLIEAGESHGWSGFARLLKLNLPARTNGEDFRKIREALALLGAVAHADEAAFLYLLEHYCGVTMADGPLPIFIEEKISVEFYLDFGQDNPDYNDLVRLCGVQQRDQASNAYEMALAKIAKLHSAIKERGTGLDLKIPVRVRFYPNGTMDGAEDIAKAEKVIKEEWAEYEQRSGKEVANGALRSTLVLQPMDISLAEYEDVIEPQLPQAIEHLVRDNVWFSTVALHLNVDAYIRNDRRTLKTVFGQLLSSVFDTKRRSIELANGPISIADMEAFSAVLNSDHPEEDLFGLPRGSVPERDVTLRAGAPIRWDLNSSLHPSSHSDSEVSPVRTFGDDGVSLWVDVLIPGYGHCQVQREDCYSSGQIRIKQNDDGGLKSLQIRLTYDTEIRDGLPRFLGTIGSSLEHLVLSEPSEALDVAMILRSCPNLHQLCLCGRLIELQLNLNNYVFDPDSPLLGNKWNQVAEISKCLSNTNNDLVRCVRPLRVQLAIPKGALGYVSGSHKGKLNAVLRMLKTNQYLERIHLIVPIKYENYRKAFSQHHLTPTTQASPLDLNVKLAFLSVTVSRKKPTTAIGNKTRKQSHSGYQLDKLDVLVFSKIFGFAAPPVLRQVAFRAVHPLF
ncbi:hypothetical protein PR001_g14213 [Phytophthora rubi]|uniref:Uncharacterized protein n=1 Tax=Phytophthora rubi TaxID=129364 RepID=A0A6A3LQV0_9STRA|nr:hypothetical protein PR001_g14213 [Phytophthora rubi]